MDDSKLTDIAGDQGMDLGSVRIADEVIASIAGIAAADVTGVVGMSSGLIGGTTNATLSPTGTATRAPAAVILVRFVGMTAAK